MNRSNEFSIIAVCAALVVVVGVVANVMSFATAPDKIASLKRKALSLESLRRHEATAAHEKAGLQALETFRGLTPISLKELADATAPGVDVDIRENDPKAALPGWRLRQADVTFAELPLQNVAAYISQAEAARPPWRLTACTIRSSPQSAGRGQVTLALEALEAQ